MTIKALRKEKGWSLDKTAEKTGVSKAMLGQIERQESSPTIATLWKIASGFDTSFSSFIEKKQTTSIKTVIRPSDKHPIHPADKKFLVNPIFPYDEQTQCEIFIIELLPGCEHLSPSHQGGVIEHILVAEGRVEVLVDTKWHVLDKGEGIQFHANQPHGYRNLTKQTAVIHDIIHYP